MYDEDQELRHIINGVQELLLGNGLVWGSDINGPMEGLPDAAQRRLVADMIHAKGILERALDTINLPRETAGASAEGGATAPAPAIPSTTEDAPAAGVTAWLQAHRDLVLTALENGVMRWCDNHRDAVLTMIESGTTRGL